MIDIHTKVLLANADDAAKTVWLTLPFDEDDLAEALSDIGVSLKDEDGEDIDTYDLIAAGESIGGYYVADWQSDYLKEEHFSDIFAASDLVERIEDLESWQTDLLDALMEDGDSLEDAIEETEDGDVDFYPNTDLTSLAEQFGDEEMFSKEFLLEHVDWEAVGRDLGMDGYVEVAGGVLRRN